MTHIMKTSTKILLSLIFLLWVVGYVGTIWPDLPGHFSLIPDGKGSPQDEMGGTFMCYVDSVPFFCTFRTFFAQTIFWYLGVSVFVCFPLASVLLLLHVFQLWRHGRLKTTLIEIRKEFF